ncbi:DNA topoisomerase IB [Nannocystis punicea]|uniref:DNA topoisomerase IB n=1 Tax=Nannocystis punicea TaxID=2995304 RepID=A0ABY7GV69_9BACT|nr:DNA topoisomerase IB [Nannocystis poenicansa]WAS90843.1 DNA topoisomerase IB [Nannocystis poenicansa]
MLPAPDAVTCADDAGLVYVTDANPGIRRRRAGNGFAYRDAKGRPVRDAELLARIRRLAIPPAWTEVWICPDPRGHIQAVGRDARGRKQYRYHPRWREVRDSTKYERMLAFAAALPAIRARVDRDLRRPRLDRDKVLATVVRLLDATHIRIGNPEYAHSNDSYGLTTMHDRHVQIHGKHIEFRFRGKAGKLHRVALDDARLAKIVRSCRDVPGQDLFQFYDHAGTHHAIGSADVNAYLRACSGSEFSAKDFRTFAGTVLAAEELWRDPRPEQKYRRKQAVTRAIERVAGCLGNTATVCRKCYVHPSVLEAYEDGAPLPAAPRGPRAYQALRPEERRAVALLLEQQRTAGQRTLSARLAASLKDRRAARHAAPRRAARHVEERRAA